MINSRIPLIEDAAHALETEVDERPIGTFGAASVFSLSKHFRGRGGVLSLEEDDNRREVVRLRDELTAPMPRGQRAVGIGRSLARSAVDTLHLRRAVNRGRHLMHPVTPVAWRIPLRAPRLEQALRGAGLGAFDEWMETGYPDYRMPQQRSALSRTLAGLRNLGRDREERIEGVRRLRELDSVAPAAREGAPLPLLRVPLLVEERDAVAVELRRRRINIYFLCPPAGRLFRSGILRTVSRSGGGPMVGGARSSDRSPRRGARARACSQERDPTETRGATVVVNEPRSGPRSAGFRASARPVPWRRGA